MWLDVDVIDIAVRQILLYIDIVYCTTVLNCIFLCVCQLA